MGAFLVLAVAMRKSTEKETVSRVAYMPSDMMYKLGEPGTGECPADFSKVVSALHCNYAGEYYEPFYGNYRNYGKVKEREKPYGCFVDTSVSHMYFNENQESEGTTGRVVCEKYLG